MSLEKRTELTKLIRKQAKDKLNAINFQKNENIIIALDLSKAKPGIVVFDKSKLEIILCTSLPGSTINKGFEVITLIESLIKKHKPGMIIFEEVFTRFISAASKLLIYKGLVYNLTLNYKIEAYDICNKTAKRVVDAKTKEEAFANLSKYLKLELDFEEFNDELDALLLVLAYLVEGEKILKKID